MGFSINCTFKKYYCLLCRDTVFLKSLLYLNIITQTKSIGLFIEHYYFFSASASSLPALFSTAVLNTSCCNIT